MTNDQPAPATLVIQDNVGVITMDDGKVNAASHQMLEALELTLDQAEEGADAVVLAGREGTFCAGFDLKVMQGAAPEARTELSARGGRLVHRLYGCPKPLVIAATGHSIALGAVLLLTADVRVGADAGYKFGLNETAIGLSLPVFATALAKDRLSAAELTPAVVASRIYDAHGAARAGFLDKVVPEPDVVDTAVATARQLSQLPGEAYGANKRAIREGSLAEVAASLAL